MDQPRHLALFLDGTWNTIRNNTNVWRLKSLCEVSAKQIIYYNAGLGTRVGEKVRGGLAGYGIDTAVIEAYEWLVENYRERDRIFIFGFSRGAYTARSLAGFILKCGLLQQGAPLSIRQLYDRYRRGAAATTIMTLDQRDKSTWSIEERWMSKYSQQPTIWFLGVWDTVGALGVPGITSHGFLEKDLRINNSRAYHALAIDEHRSRFAPTLWTRTVPNPRDPRTLSDVEQRWFVGAHANVGGGCESDFLAQIPLRWMMGKAQQHGLTFRMALETDSDELTASISDSYAEFLCGFYPAITLWQRHYRPIGAAPVDIGGGQVRETINETIDMSVFDRWRSDPSYRPKNLIAWQAAHNADISQLRQSARADDPTVAAPDPPIAPEPIVASKTPDAASLATRTPTV